MVWRRVENQGQLGFGSLDDQVKVVTHQHVGMHPDAEDLCGAPEALYKARPVVIVAEDCPPVVAPAGDVIKRVRV